MEDQVGAFGFIALHWKLIVITMEQSLRMLVGWYCTCKYNHLCCIL